jgi:hypothetical protein
MMKITFALVAGLLLASTSAMSEMGYQLRETTIDSNSLSSAEEKLRTAYELCEADFAPGVNGLQHVYSVPECQKIKQLWDTSSAKKKHYADLKQQEEERLAKERLFIVEVANQTTGPTILVKPGH